MFHHTNGSSGVYDQDLWILGIWAGVTRGAQADSFLQLKHKTRLKGKGRGIAAIYSNIFRIRSLVKYNYFEVLLHLSILSSVNDRP